MFVFPGHGTLYPGRRGARLRTAANLALLRSVQPVGPYRIGGWSLGAMIAHEMARQLFAQGERVETLPRIAGFLPSTRVRRDLPVGVRPGYLLGGVRLRATGGPLGRYSIYKEKGARNMDVYSTPISARCCVMCPARWTFPR